jgi:hypothetical protein
MENQKNLIKRIENEYDNSGGNLALSREELKTHFELTKSETDYIMEELEKTEKFHIWEEYDEALKKRISRLRIKSRYSRNYWLHEKMTKEEAYVLIKLGKKFYDAYNVRYIDVEAENNHLVNLDLRKRDLPVERSLTNIPKEIGIFKHLRILKLPHNDLTQLPDSIGNLSQLKILDLDDNQIKALPESIGNLQSLEELYLNQNQLEELPKTIKKLRQLKIIGLDRNEFKNKEKWEKLLEHVPRIHWGNQLPDIREAKRNRITILVLTKDYVKQYIMDGALRKKHVDKTSIMNMMISHGVIPHHKILKVRGHKIGVLLLLPFSPIPIIQRELQTQNPICLIVYDKTDLQEISWFPKIVKECKHVFKENPLTAILGLKGDKELISTSEGQAKAKELGCLYYETKIGDFLGLDEIIQVLVEHVSYPNIKKRVRDK